MEDGDMRWTEADARMIAEMIWELRGEAMNRHWQAQRRTEAADAE